LISHTHDSSTPKLHPDRVLGSTAMSSCSGPRSGSKEVCGTLYTTVYYSVHYMSIIYYTCTLETPTCNIHVYWNMYIIQIMRLRISVLPFPPPPLFPSPLPPPLFPLPSSHLNLIVLQLLAVFKEVNGKLGVLHTANSRVLLPHTGPEHHEGACRLKLWLQPVFCVGIIVGNIDP